MALSGESIHLRLESSSTSVSFTFAPIPALAKWQQSRERQREKATNDTRHGLPRLAWLRLRRGDCTRQNKSVVGKRQETDDLYSPAIDAAESYERLNQCHDAPSPSHPWPLSLSLPVSRLFSNDEKKKSRHHLQAWQLLTINCVQLLLRLLHPSSNPVPVINKPLVLHHRLVELVRAPTRRRHQRQLQLLHLLFPINLIPNTLRGLTIYPNTGATPIPRPLPLPCLNTPPGTSATLRKSRRTSNQWPTSSCDA